MWGLKVFRVEVTNVVLKGFLASRLPMWGLKFLWKSDCVAVRYLTPYFSYLVLPHVDLAGAMPCPKKVHKKYKKGKIKTDKRRKTFLSDFPLFTWWMD